MKNPNHSLKNEKGKTAKIRLLSFLSTAFFTILGFLVAFPFIAMILGSFYPGEYLIGHGLAIKIDPDRMSLNNYILLFSGKQNKYFMWYKNSLILTALTVILTLFVCYFVAYGLAMYEYRLKNLLFFLVIATMMVPFEILILPLFKMMVGIKLIDTTAGVILPGLVGASSVFFFKQFMSGLPRELLDSGRIDGATEFGICIRIMMPITKPAFAAMAILSSMGAWNSMLWPMLVYRSATKFTLPIGLNTLLTPYGNDYDLLIIGSVFAVLPIFIIFLIFQRYFVEGMTAGALKG